MEWYFILLIAFSATVVTLFALWLFLIAPRAKKKEMQPFLRPYAHRGLWGGGLPENSLGAFRAAADAGFAIELDIHLSRDGKVMVFHDYTLTRMCGRDVKLADLTAKELCEIPLNGVESECIPTLRQVLDAVDGRVPLLIELKGESGNTALVPAALKELKDYQGLWCMETFNPLLLRAVKKHAPHVMRGLLSNDLMRVDGGKSTLVNFLLSAHLLNFLCRPNFIAWNYKFPNRLALRTGLRLFGASSMIYTVQDNDTYQHFLQKDTFPIFDGFVPNDTER